MSTKIDDDVVITGNLTLGGTLRPPQERENFVQEILVPYPIKLTDFRVWDALQTPLPGTAATDDLAITGGTWGTHAPKLTSGDVKAAGSVTRRARATLSLPAEYEAGETVSIRLSCATETTIADVSCTVDVEAFIIGRDGTIDGADLYVGAAQSINSTTWADINFSLTPTLLEPGTEIDIRVTIASNDAATAGVVQPSIGCAEILADIKG